MKSNLALLGLFIFLGSCGEKQPAPLFEALKPEQTGVDFVNEVRDAKDFNIFNYRNFYNGGGVALGDVNADGKPDLFVTSNFGDNKLYLNRTEAGRGDFKFEDVTAKAGVAGKHAWSTGVTFADVNGDGHMDIYVCNAGSKQNDDRANELYLSNGVAPGGVPTYTERAAAYGLDDRGYSTHAAFFDYDRDGDLDMYLLNNSFIPIGKLGYRNLRNERDPEGGDKLFRNDGNRFTDVSAQAGIYGSVIGFGLGITVGDINEDGWLDLYISNDFYERDYLYLNNRDGTFREGMKDAFGHVSLSSMGADLADINNDGYLDLFSTDMLPGDDRRLKTTMTYESYELEQFKLSQDYHYQYTRNMLQLNSGPVAAASEGTRQAGNPDVTFSEIGQLAGVSSTDWSWGALMLDLDNDGLKDLFVANGINKNLTDQDFIAFFSDDKTVQRVVSGAGFNYEEFLKEMQSEPIPNYAFRNEGNLQFRNVAKEWGLGEPSLSNGAAYGDLDGDGDLDLVVNNVNEPLSIFKNHTTERLKRHFLRVKLTGEGRNPSAVGAKVYVHQPGRTQYQQQMPNRGFQSSSDLTLVFGLGDQPRIDSVTVIWPDDRRQVLRGVKADGTLEVAKSSSRQVVSGPPRGLNSDFHLRLGNLATWRLGDFDYRHEENAFVDYNRDPLLKQALSTQGPPLAVGDVDGDGREDVYLGGAAGKPKILMRQQPGGTFRSTSFQGASTDLVHEDIAAAFFDADGDGDPDLYVVSGGNEFLPGSPELADRLYLNDGKGTFTKDTRLPNLDANGSCVAPADFDRDGDVDLFVGSRMISGKYGLSPSHVLLVNDGRGGFKIQTKRYLPDGGRDLGMVTDATWADLDRNGWPDLLIAQDWGPIQVFLNQNGKLTNHQSPITTASGWWNRLRTVDLDGDGDLDVLAGNLGLNNRYNASTEHPAELFVNDFDRNGSVEQIIQCHTEDGQSYPMVLKPDLQKALPSIKKKFVKHQEYANKTVEQLFDAPALEGVVRREATEARSGVFLNDGKGTLTFRPFPVEAQFAPIFALEPLDVDGDGKLDLVLAGNFFDVLPELGRFDASYGTVLKGDGRGHFRVLPRQQSGLFVRGQVRRSAVVRAGTRQILLLIKNNDAAQAYEVMKSVE